MEEMFLKFMKDCCEIFQNEIKRRVMQAFENLWKLEKSGDPEIPSGYFMTLFKGHLLGKEGSNFKFKEPEDLLGAIFMPPMSFEIVPAKAIPNSLGFCTYVRIPLNGKLGAKLLSEYDGPLKTKIDHAGHVQLVGEGEKPSVDYSYIVLGPCSGKEVVFTLFPGDPLPPSNVSKDFVGDLLNKEITKYQANGLGFKTVKFE